MKLQKMREQGKQADDEAFNAVLKNTFGKPLGSKEQLDEAEQTGALDLIRVKHKDGTTENLESSFARKLNPDDYVRK